MMDLPWDLVRTNPDPRTMGDLETRTLRALGVSPCVQLEPPPPALDNLSHRPSLLASAAAVHVPHCHQPSSPSSASLTSPVTTSVFRRWQPVAYESPAANPTPLYWRPSSGLSHHHEILLRMSKYLDIIVRLHSLLICAAII